MKLDAWLRQRHSRAERFRLVERLSQALNAVHDRGEALVSLEPSRVEVGAGLVCDVSGAARGRPEPGYAAPERLEGGAPSTEADVYSAGAIAWEVLVGRPCGERPAPLADVAPDLPRELANAVTGCLERSPQWRPKDLTYLAQLAAAQQKSGRPDTTPGVSRAATPRPGARRLRGASPRRSRRQWPLLLATVVVLAGAALGYRTIRSQMAGAPSESPSAAPATPSPVRTPSPAPAARTADRTPLPRAGTPLPRPSAASPTPSREVEAPPPPATPTPDLEPDPTPMPTPVPTPTPTPVPPPTPTPAAAQPVELPSAREPVSLSSVSPVTVRRPGRILFDLHGTGLRADLIVRIMAVRQMPRGITVARQKWVSATLMTALLELDESVKPAVYAIALEDPTGGPLKTLPFTVTK